MTPERTAKWMRGLTIAVFVVAVGLAIRLALVALDGGNDTRRLDTTEEAYSVIDALVLSGTEPVPVRGWVFSGPVLELRLCYGRDDSGGAPRCEGAYLSLGGQVNEGSFDLRSAETEHGEVRYSSHPVVVRGTLVGTAMTVDLVLDQ